MRTKDCIYFSPEYQFIKLKWDNKETLIAAFEDRINGFYFEPAEKLNRKNQAFAAGIICLSVMDLLANIENGSQGVGYRFKYWLRMNIQEFDQPDPDGIYHNLAHRFYKEFRNSLVHECRIKNAGQFSYDYKEIIHFIKDSQRSIMIVNPNLLLHSLKEAFNKYITIIKDDDSEYQKFHRMMNRNFFIDFDCAERDLNENMDLHD